MIQSDSVLYYLDSARNHVKATKSTTELVQKEYEAACNALQLDNKLLKQKKEELELSHKLLTESFEETSAKSRQYREENELLKEQISERDSQIYELRLRLNADATNTQLELDKQKLELLETNRSKKELETKFNELEAKYKDLSDKHAKADHIIVNLLRKMKGLPVIQSSDLVKN